MIGALRPFDAFGHTHVAHTEAAHIDAVEAQPRQHARVRARDQRPIAGAPRQQSIEAPPQLLATVEAGRTLGEMSMIDGEARFASCVAAEPAMIAVLDREALARIIVEQPLLGAKILMELVLMLSQRLRATSQRLLGLLDEQSQRSVNAL